MWCDCIFRICWRVTHPPNICYHGKCCLIDNWKSTYTICYEREQWKCKTIGQMFHNVTITPIISLSLHYFGILPAVKELDHGQNNDQIHYSIL